ncbi:PIN domain-containing protein [Pseudomonas sp. BP01]|uniref:PIN domain-containing protein n=1 Tax=Pseudomonas sp. BP01 TaxID=2976152 RepID=UPI002872D33F|nr:PIN domain-containing protein [Pseudomonas sp. BP01]
MVSVYVVLDSNIYCYDYFFQSGAFKYLIRYVNNIDATLLLPQVVIDEVKNARDRSVLEELQIIEKSQQALKRVSKKDFSGLVHEVEEYDLLKRISAQVSNVKIVPYSAVSNAEIFARALKVKRPFKAGEKGYRDTLLWLSLMEHLKAEGAPAEVVFINSNRHDFYTDKIIAFHPDLLEDLKAISFVEMVPYGSVADFVATIDKVEHAFDHASDIALFENYVEDEAIDYLQSMGANVLQSLDFSLADGGGLLMHATDVRASIGEGVEDYNIESISRYDDEKVFVSYIHDLRIFFLDVTVPQAAYDLYRSCLRHSRHLYNTEEGAGEVILRFSLRPTFQTSFIYDVKHEVCSGYTGEILSIR